MTGHRFLGEPPASAEADAMRAADERDHGFVMDLTELWAHAPELHEQLFAVAAAAAERAGLTLAERGVLVSACASARDDAYCSFAWGARLASERTPEVAAAVLLGTDEGLGPRERALATWARQVVRSPGAATAADVRVLRDAGFDDAAVLGITTYVAVRQAFSAVNGALGARPDAQLVAEAPAAVRRAVTWGRAPLTG